MKQIGLNRTYVNACALIMVLAACIAGSYLVALAYLVVFGLVRGREWLNDGWIPAKNLEEARDAALRKTLPKPNSDNIDWYRWACSVADEVLPEDDRLPGGDNHAVFPYLVEEHDSNRMEFLLNLRIWPKPCKCERNPDHPWKFDHVITCKEHPEYVDPDTVCKCIKKRRKGKTRVYRSMKCTIHTTDAERKAADTEGDEDDYGWFDEDEDDVGAFIAKSENQILAAMGVPPQILYPSSRPPSVYGATVPQPPPPPKKDQLGIKSYQTYADGEMCVKFKCGCMYFTKEDIVAKQGMCGIEHGKIDELREELGMDPLLPLPDDDDDGMRIK